MRRDVCKVGHKPTPERMIHIGGNHYMLDTSKLKNEPTKGRD